MHFFTKFARNLHKTARSLKGKNETFTKRYISTHELPEKCSAVIIGGGSIGCSTFYHLTKLGLTDILLLERHKLTSGTTWHTAGLVWSLRPNDTEIELLQITRDLLARLEAETGVAPGWEKVGGLFLASTKERLDEYKRLHTIGHAFGIESHILGPQESTEIYPLLDPSTVYGTLYSPADGHVDPSGLCHALTKYGKGLGGKVVENCGVQGIQTQPSLLGSKKVTGVLTNRGFVATEVVINCTGAWSPQVLAGLGVSIPLIPMKHSYVVFDKIEGAKGLPNMRDHDGSVYFRVHGDTLAIGGYEPDPIILEKVDPDFAFGLYELDWDVFGKHLEVASLRIPKLKEVGVRSSICGPESFTPDHKPIMGEDPNVLGLYHGVGFNSAGMMMGGGCGSQLAKWVVQGEPDLDMFGYDIKRFLPKLCKDKLWARERSHEAYAQNYNIVYKNDEKLGGRNKLLSPLHETLQEQGCFYQERGGWERPGLFLKEPNPVQPYDYYGQYGHARNEDIRYKEALAGEYSFGFSKHYETIREESLACRNACAIFDMSYFGKFFLTGPQAEEAASYIFSGDLKKPPGSTVYTCILNKNGGIEADLTVTVLDGRQRLKEDPQFEGPAYYVAVGGTTSFYTYSRIMSILRSHPFPKTSLHDRSEEYGLLSVQGPNSRALLQEALSEKVYLDNETFPFSTHKVVDIEGVNVRMMRLSFVGEMGWELHVPRDKVFKVYHKICEIGKAKYGLRNAGYRAIDSLSIEKGYRHWHADIRSDDSPLEAGLSFTCDLKKKSDFHGREALLQYKSKGKLKKKLFCFTIDYKDTPLWGLETIWNDDKEEPVGYLRRADYGFFIDNGIGYGYMYDEDSIKNWKQGKFSLELMGSRVPAQVHVKSPFDPLGLRIQGTYSQV